MRPLALFTVAFLWHPAAHGQPLRPLPGDTAGIAKAMAIIKTVKTGTVRLQFIMHTPFEVHHDSMFVIFDRFDRTGAGVICQLFATDTAHSIEISLIPVGKYYVTIDCRGLHRDHLETIMTVRARKTKRQTIRLRDAEIYSRNKVIIPPFHPAFRDMSILRSR